MCNKPNKIKLFTEVWKVRWLRVQQSLKSNYVMIKELHILVLHFTAADRQELQASVCGCRTLVSDCSCCGVVFSDREWSVKHSHFSLPSWWLPSISCASLKWFIITGSSKALNWVASISVIDTQESVCLFFIYISLTSLKTSYCGLWGFVCNMFVACFFHGTKIGPLLKQDATKNDQFNSSLFV